MADTSTLDVARKLVREASDLPTLPSVVVQLMAASEDDASAQRVARIVETDPPLTAKILRIANSPLFAQARQVKTIERAATILGTEAVKRHALTVSVADILGAGCVPEDQRANVWAHSLTTSAIARVLVRRLRCVDPEAAVVGGLLHDIGVVMLFLTSSERYAAVGAIARTKGTSVIHAEREVFGTDHCAVGAVLADEWCLPDVYREIMARHHDETIVRDAKRQELSALHVVHLASFLADILGIEVHRDIPWSKIDLSAWSELGFDVARISDDLAEIETMVNESTEVLGLEPINLVESSSFVLSANREFLHWSSIAQQTTRRLRNSVSDLAIVCREFSGVLACQSAGQALDVFLRDVAHELSFERIAVFSVDPYRRSIVPRGIVGAKVEGVTLPLLSMTDAHDPCVQVASGGPARFVRAANGDAAPAPILSALGAPDAVVAPVVGELDTYGILVTDAPESKRPFDDLDSTVLTAIGRQLGITIDSAIIQHQLREEARNLQEQAIRDGLTGVYNYRYFREQLEIEVSRARRSNAVFSLILVDLDHFKKFNDTYGHEAGNDMLVRFVEIAIQTFRSSDTVFRYGGEEFAVLLPETPKASAVIPCESLLAAIRMATLSDITQDGELPKITASIGIAEFPGDGKEAGELIGRADAALYNAKAQGRDRLSLA